MFLSILITVIFVIKQYQNFPFIQYYYQFKNQNRQLQMNMNGEDNSFNSQYGQEYAITLQYELQREKQKNKILQERLRNKQIFILQMKKMQGEIQLFNEKCRIQLQQQRAMRNTLQNVTLRQYAETIAELEHKVSLLQQSEGLYYRQQIDKKVTKNKSSAKLQQMKADKLAKQIDKQKQQENQLLKRFTKRFLQMYSFYNKQNNESSYKKKLKSGWKWIKSIVQEWQQQQKIINTIRQFANQCIKNQQECDPQEILNLTQNKNEQNDDNEN